ncbi:LacI family transcriptional regulator [Shewanella schlegeliana]|uniref:LacI family DNA-binding transcriptional regulator n=1 Tax=Shewanella schlegeliana TaxID=190308 RepID=A0ABS1SW06_9GAMM|nr:LacI family DNA-binding transcriptional regulator [Shewanella schlegeliana]MBL4912094.1 LacI family DNA-binding transcriptional regulator [Shewanella schlegeliana]MCL1111308.1 LacI family transcriptional regulator [Shewanella schlegeliana]GIU32961.1 LacI family transcriptional regulator [Shewanella schlegeliana]
MRKIKLADIAKVANVSSITVSRALSTPEKVKPETCEKIQKIAQDMGYIPNFMAKGLKSKSKTIGVIVPTIINPFFASAVKSIIRSANKTGYNCLLFSSDESQSIEQNAVNTLISYNIDGVIIAVISEDEHYTPAYFSTLKKLEIPVVLLDRHIDAPHVCGVYLDNIDSGYKLGKEVISNNFQRILIVSGSPNSKVANARLAGLKMAAEEAGSSVIIDVIKADFNTELAKRLVQDYLGQHKPDAIIGLNNQITLGALEASVVHNYQLGSDIHFYSIDEIKTAKNFGISIPCIRHDVEDFGYHAVTQLIRAIESDNCDKLSDIIIRGTVVK